ncbi:hypothetical protein SNEBB_001121 [Seison nebaliae]|nr:hypothetical protein SNEBB_001121 [Seison nebaliae]
MMLVNELLTYAIHYVNSSAVENIKKIIINFYSDDEIVQAKKLLWSKCKSLGKYQERKSTDTRPVSVPHVADIMDALKLLDASNEIPDIVAKNVDKIPDRQPEELNLLMLVQRVAKLEGMLKVHEDSLSTLSIDVMDIKECSNNRSFKSVVMENSSQVQARKAAASGSAGNDRPGNRQHNVRTPIGSIANVASKAHTNNVLKSKSMPDVSNSNTIDTPYNRFSVVEHQNSNTDSVLLQGGNNGLHSDGFTNVSFSRQDGGFTEVMSRKKRKRVFGCNSEPVAGLRGAPPPPRHIFVSRVAEGDARAVAALLKQNKIEVIDAKKVSHESAKFCSFKVSICKDDYLKCMSGNMWPPGVTCQAWREPKRITSNENIIGCITTNNSNIDSSN